MTFLARLFDDRTVRFKSWVQPVAPLGAERGDGVRLEGHVVDVAKAEPSLLSKSLT